MDSPGPKWQEAWIAALDAWSNGNLPLAFHYCQAASARGLDSPDLFGLMASIALGLEQYEQAKRYVEEAQRQRAASARLAERRYHVIQPWGCGFWGEIDHVIGQLAAAEIMGRIPIIHWGRHGAYGAAGYDNAWEAYFLPASSARLEDVEHPELSFFPSYWTHENVRRTSIESGRRFSERTSSINFLPVQEDVTVADCHNRLLDILPWAPAGHWLSGATAEQAYRRLFKKYLHLTPQIAADVDSLASTLLTQRPVLAVHFRAQSVSKDVESLERSRLDIDHYIPVIDAFMRDHPAGSIFLLTDLERCAAAMSNRYGSRLRILPATRLADESEIEVRVKLGVNLQDAARDVILDVYLAARCDAFLGDGASGVSCAVGAMKEWEPTSFLLLRGNVTLEPGRVQPF